MAQPKITHASLNKQIVTCRKCPRLVKWREKIAKTKRASYREENYWGKPILGFGDPKARLLILGLAPGAHGANRTGRVFTGDRSGEWLFRALYDAGFANQPETLSKGDGLKLTGAYVSLVVRCVPPKNKPTPQERDQCLSYLDDELRILKHVKVILILGFFALDGILRIFMNRGIKISPKPKFAHGLERKFGPYTLLCSFHPSQQNTFTGKLTKPMFAKIFKRAHRLL